jgi:predicted GIY-YIG superfamily endonuclease
LGLSIAKNELYYIYVLRIEGNGWYVGSTKNFVRRMRSHFAKGGACATRERKALAIEEVFELLDYQIRTDCAHERAEVLIAHRYANRFGMECVRGGKHGRGWNDQPSPGNLRDIERYRKFSQTEEGQLLLNALRPVDPVNLLPVRLTGALRNLQCQPEPIIPKTDQSFV